MYSITFVLTMTNTFERNKLVKELFSISYSKLTCKVGAGCLSITDASSLFFFSLIDPSGLFFFCALASFAFCFRFLTTPEGGRFSLSTESSFSTGVNDCLRNSQSNLQSTVGSSEKRIQLNQYLALHAMK